MTVDQEPEVELKTIPRIARHLRAIYREEFGGKAEGRFRMSRTNFKEVCGRQHLNDSTVQAIADELLEHGYVLTNAYEFFLVQKLDALRAVRRVPRSVRSKYSI